MVISFSDFHEGPRGYYATGSDGWGYVVGYDRWDISFLASALKAACASGKPYTVTWIAGNRYRWIRHLEPVPESEQLRRAALVQLLALPDESTLNRTHVLVCEGAPNRHALVAQLTRRYRAWQLGADDE